MSDNPDDPSYCDHNQGDWRPTLEEKEISRLEAIVLKLRANLALSENALRKIYDEVDPIEDGAPDSTSEALLANRIKGYCIDSGLIVSGRERGLRSAG